MDDPELAALRQKRMAEMQQQIGEKIAVTGANSYEWIVTYMAVIIGGGVVLPIDGGFAAFSGV